MNRDKWKLTYSAAAVLGGAKEKLAFYDGRLRWWEAKKNEVVTQIKSEGVEIDESLADIVSNSYHRGATVNIRNDLLKDLNECVTKIQEHRANVSEYSAWEQVLSHQAAEMPLDLHHDDWMYFFGE